MSVIEERLAAAEMRARSFRAQADQADAEAAMLRQQIADGVAATRAAELAEESVQSIQVDGARGALQAIQSPWSVMGLGARRRLIGVGIDGRLLAVYELRDTTRARGDKRLKLIHGSTPTAVDLAVHRRFA